MEPEAFEIGALALTPKAPNDLTDESLDDLVLLISYETET